MLSGFEVTAFGAKRDNDGWNPKVIKEISLLLDGRILRT